MRRCPRCGRTLPENDFYRMGNRLQGWCRECSRSYNREWRRDNPGKRYLPCPAGWQEDRMLACPCKRIVCCICSLLSIVFAILIVCYDGSSTRRKGCAMGAYFHVIDRRDSESIERFRRELGRLRETEHLHSDRRERVRRIARDIGFGHPVRQCLVDTGHAAGLEVHVLTNTGIVLVFNAGSGKLVTVLIARPGQVRRYYEPFGEAVPRDILERAYRNACVNHWNY